MSLSIAASRQDIRDRLTANFAQTSFEGSVPSATNLVRINGAVIPYIVYRFPDIIPGADTSFIGPRGDTYEQMVYFVAVGPDMASTTALYLKLLDQFLAFQPSYSGMMRKRSGGGTYEIGVDNGATEAFVAPINFAFSTSLLTLP